MSVSTQHRLRKHADYQHVYKTGRKKWANQLAYFSVLRDGSPSAARSETAGTRVGLTVPKALGKAIDRNRIKRRLRELVRKLLPLTGGLPVDVVLHPKRSVLTANFTALEHEIGQIFQAVRSKTPSGNTPRLSSSAPMQAGSSSRPPRKLLR